MLKAVLENIEAQILKKYEASLDELASLRYVYDSSEKRTFISGKIEAYEEIALLLKALIVS